MEPQPKAAWTQTCRGSHHHRPLSGLLRPSSSEFQGCRRFPPQRSSGRRRCRLWVRHYMALVNVSLAGSSIPRDAPTAPGVPSATCAAPQSARGGGGRRGRSTAPLVTQRSRSQKWRRTRTWTSWQFLRRHVLRTMPRISFHPLSEPITCLSCLDELFRSIWDCVGPSCLLRVAVFVDTLTTLV